MCSPTGESPAQIYLQAVLADSLQPLFATVLCFHPDCLSAQEGILTFTPYADYENYYETCNPEAFIMACTTCSKMNV